MLRVCVKGSRRGWPCLALFDGLDGKEMGQTNGLLSFFVNFSFCCIIRLIGALLLLRSYNFSLLPGFFSFFKCNFHFYLFAVSLFGRFRNSLIVSFPFMAKFRRPWINERDMRLIKLLALGNFVLSYVFFYIM